MSSGGQRWWSSLSTAGGVVVLGSRCEQLAQSRYAAAQTSFDATGESMSVNADCRYRMADGCKQPVLMFSCLDLIKLVSKYVGMRVSDFCGTAYQKSQSAACLDSLKPLLGGLDLVLATMV